MKKKNAFFIAALLSVVGMQTALAQKMTVNLVGGEAVEYDVTKVESVTFSEGEPIIIENHEYVDLGLPSGTLWATCNVGASKPEEAGDYFAWGETQPKDTYNWSTYLLCDGSYNTLTKYCTNESFGTVDNITELEPEDDVAAANWGSEWQMPTREQILELVSSNNTTTTWTTQNGVDGRLITSKVNGNSIFLPANGYYNESSLQSAGTACYYWSRSLDASSNDLGQGLYYSSDYLLTNSTRRYYGRAVRPVRVKEVVEHEYVDLGLPSGTLWATCNVGANKPEEFGDYFAWGETEPKNNYSWETYKWCMGTKQTLTRYCFSSTYGYNGFTDDLKELLPEDDAATVNWGEEWQTPNFEQTNELYDNTTTVWTTQGGVYGRLCTGSNGNSIFLPAAGFRSDTSLTNDGSGGYYWSRSRGAAPWYYSPYYLFINSEYIFLTKEERDYGFPIRPVRKK